MIPRTKPTHIASTARCGANSLTPGSLHPNAPNQTSCLHLDEGNGDPHLTQIYSQWGQISSSTIVHFSNPHNPNKISQLPNLPPTSTSKPKCHSTDSLPPSPSRVPRQPREESLQAATEPQTSLSLSSLFFSLSQPPNTKAPKPCQKKQYRSQAGRSSPPSTLPLPAVSPPSEGSPGSRKKPRAGL